MSVAKTASRGTSTAFFAKKYAKRSSSMPEPGAASRQKTARSLPKTRSDARDAVRPTPRFSMKKSVCASLNLGSKMVIQRRFNVSVPRARVTEKASTLRDRSER